MFRRNIIRGALFVEYAVMLAFIITVGIVFIDNNGLATSIQNIFASTNNVLDGATANKEEKSPLQNPQMRDADKALAAILDYYDKNKGSLSFSNQGLQPVTIDGYNVSLYYRIPNFNTETGNNDSDNNTYHLFEGPTASEVANGYNIRAVYIKDKGIVSYAYRTEEGKLVRWEKDVVAGAYNWRSDDPSFASDIDILNKK